MRRCPNSECNALVCIIFDEENDQRIAYPPEVIDFDATNLPPTILTSLEEAVTCHSAGCYRAASLMIRRVLEELCADKGAKGADLSKRIMSLSSVAVIPTELIEAADELRLLGNDAAHVEAKSYDAITEKEAALAIDLAKELLKAVYQYTSLVARLRDLKRPPAASSSE